MWCGIIGDQLISLYSFLQCLTGGNYTNGSSFDLNIYGNELYSSE